MRESTRLFHLHFHVPDVAHAERVLADAGLPRNGRFGSVGDDPVRVGPGETDPEGFRFRLQDHQRGYANVTLTRGPRVRFDHLGVCTGEFDGVVERAKDAGWRVLPNDRRTFLLSPWGFRVELQRDGGDVERGLGSWEAAHLSAAALAVPDADAVRSGLTTVLGSVPGLAVAAGEADERATVPNFDLAGSAFPSGRRVETAALAARSSGGATVTGR